LLYVHFVLVLTGRPQDEESLTVIEDPLAQRGTENLLVILHHVSAQRDEYVFIPLPHLLIQAVPNKKGFTWHEMEYVIATCLFRLDRRRHRSGVVRPELYTGTGDCGLDSEICD
jgi:hypothetical protein